MKKYYVFLSALFFSFTINAQVINIPDSVFKSRLVNTNNTVDNDGDGIINNNADTNDDGEIDVNEALAVTMMNVGTPGGGVWSEIQSIEGLQYFTNLTYLDCRFNDITSMDVSMLTSLETLICYTNEISSINLASLSALEYLSCGANPISSIDLSDLTSLTYLNIGHSTTLGGILDVSALSNLETLIYYFSSIPTLNLENLTNLQEIDCRGNNITNFDFLSGLSHLRVLDCSINSLTNIDISNLLNLEELNCSENQLTTLELPANMNLLDLDCSQNQLTALDLSLVSNLFSLRCSNNQLTELNVNHLIDLYEVYFDNNFLTSFDTNGINYIGFVSGSNNQLTTVNLKDGSSPGYWDFYEYLAGYSFSNNPLEVICVDDFGYEATHLSAYNTSTYCTFVPGGDYNTVQGQTYFDTNGNGCDNTDPILLNLVYNISSGSSSGSVISNDEGEYAFYLGNNTYSFYPTLENPNYFSIAPSSAMVSFPTDPSPFIQDFCVTANGMHHDLEITLIPIDAARPGFDTNYKLIYKNKGTTTLSGSIELSFQDDIMDFVSALPSQDTQVMNLLTWNFTDLKPFESRQIALTMNINAPTDSPPVNGDDILVFNASINTIETDETPNDNFAILNQTVVNSFDPNDKTCLEGEFITPETVSEYVHYIIRFENTGTANAINVVIKDDIDITKYDLSTLVPLHASHNYFAIIKDQENDHYIEFIFEGINLPFDDANNDGFVAFKIKTYGTLELGDSFENDAEIYFDFNSAIVTNNAITTIATLSVDEFEQANTNVFLYPNPTTNIIHLKAKQPIEQVNIYDVTGRLIQTIAVIGSKTSIDFTTENLNSGTYFVKIESKNGAIVKKIIKD